MTVEKRKVALGYAIAPSLFNTKSRIQMFYNCTNLLQHYPICKTFEGTLFWFFFLKKEQYIF
ncbi:hypothetical protein C5749_13975 [Sphingobacterium gobiense]|uniref:Uncharacterized protein n=1 Tax=Sphingobacterium gobiense TaxID=1382456 RepID=A0A2S9JN36_9SPHI|nr:hypothetical protein C5749_13975 [Sphingobacterium gobiense]